MSERKQAEQFNQAWEGNARRLDGSPAEEPPEAVKQALDMALRVSRLDYSSESQLRDSLRRQLQAEYAAAPVQSARKFNWTSGLAVLGSVAGLAILMACFVLGFSWIIRSFLPGVGPASEAPPEVAVLPATEVALQASPASTSTPAALAAAATPDQSPQALPPVLGVESSPDTIRHQMQDPAWDTIWLQGDILTQDSDGQPAVVQVEAWMDKEGRGRVLSTAPLEAQTLEEPFNPGRQPNQVWISDGQLVQRFDRETGEVELASLEQGSSEQLLALAGPILDLLYSLDLPGSVEGMQVLNNTSWADRPAVQVDWDGSTYWIDSQTGQVLRLQKKGNADQIVQEITLDTVLYNIPLTEEALNAENLAAASFRAVGSVAPEEPALTPERPVPTEAPLVPPSTPTPAAPSSEPIRITLVSEPASGAAASSQAAELYFTLRSLAAPIERSLARLPLACLLDESSCQALAVQGSPALQDTPLHWSRDGRRALLIDFAGNRLWRFDARGGSWTPVAENLRATSDIAVWSPEGDWIAVTTQADGSQDSLITLVPPEPGQDGPAARVFAQELGGMQVPLGWQAADRLIFMRADLAPKGSDQEQAAPRLFRLDTSSGEVEQLEIKGNPAWLTDYPALTAGGGRLALSLAGEEGGLAVYNLQSGETDRLELAGSRPVWSPDGNRIAYLVSRKTDSGQVIDVMVSDDSGTDQWKAFEWGTVPEVLWLPDSEHLLIAVGPQGDEPPDNKSAFFLVEYQTGEARPLALEGTEQEYEFIAPAVRPPGGE